MRPYLDKAVPEVWRSAASFSEAVKRSSEQHGLELALAELIKVRASQLNGCAFCLDLHSREARAAGVPQQKLDLLPAWRETDLFSERDRAALAIAEAATLLPLSEESHADLEGARLLLGDEAFAAAEWVAVAINAFNRVSILSGHAVRPRTDNGDLAR